MLKIMGDKDWITAAISLLAIMVSSYALWVSHHKSEAERRRALACKRIASQATVFWKQCEFVFVAFKNKSEIDRNYFMPSMRDNARSLFELISAALDDGVWGDVVGLDALAIVEHIDFTQALRAYGASNDMSPIDPRPGPNVYEGLARLLQRLNASGALSAPQQETVEAALAED